MLRHSATGITHNHPEGVKGAQATAAAVFLARTGYEKCDIQQYITKRFGYNLEQNCNDIRLGYWFNETCQETVPQAIIAWLDSDCFEDAIRNAVSLGGDSDTLAAITGAIAQADYGIPPFIAVQAYQCLDAPLQKLCIEFVQKIMCLKY